MEPPKSSTPSFSQSSTIISSSVSNPPPPPPCLKTSVDDHDRVLLLDLSLSTKEKDNSNHGSKPELNLIDCFKTINSSSSSTSQGSLDDDHYNTHPPPPPPPPPPDHQADQGNDQSCTDHDHDQPRVFSCNYCQRKFYSSQALGGHQNAHKRERTLAKRGQRNITTASSVSFLGFSCPPNRSSSSSSSYPSMASLPLHGCSLNRSLGIQVHSMIHKPSNFLPSNNSMMIMNSPHIFGQNGWSSSRSQVVIDQQPAIGRLAQDSFLQVGMISNNILGSSPSSSSISSSTHVVSGGAARFDQGVRKFSQPSEGINKGYWWDSVSPFKTKQDDLQKLDLSLKL